MITTVYFITNNNTFQKEMIYQKDIPEEKKKELIPLSTAGEKTAKQLLTIKELLNTTEVYTSNYISMIDTAKYLADQLGLSIMIDERLKERKTGILGNNSEISLKEIQEHDFDYKCHNGESMQNVQDRMKEVLKDILFRHENEMVSVFTHDIALESLLSIWCEKGYNLENGLILSYKEEVIMDGAFHSQRIFRLEFEGMTLKSMKWMNEDE